jgi:hypothetical protein
MRDRREAYRSLVDRPDGKRPLGRTDIRWEYNITMKLQEPGWTATDLAQDRKRWRILVNAVINLRVPFNAGNFLAK